MATHILFRQGQSQTNAVKAQDYGNIVLGLAWCFAGGLNTTRNNDQPRCLLRNSTKLQRAFQNKLRGMLSKGVLLIHDNARPHTSRSTQELIESFDWEVLDHVPYSSDLAPSDFHLFRYLKHNLGGKRFSGNEEVKAAVNSWLHDQTADLFKEGFKNLVLRYAKCINKLGNYVEKQAKVSIFLK
ncbi:mariner Mos1 transposase [Trichonephila clavipes]|nr:mariner Mos1 transposase [Trichonephila clavipes]